MSQFNSEHWHLLSVGGYIQSVSNIVNTLLTAIMLNTIPDPLHNGQTNTIALAMVFSLCHHVVQVVLHAGIASMENTTAIVKHKPGIIHTALALFQVLLIFFTPTSSFHTNNFTPDLKSFLTYSQYIYIYNILHLVFQLCWMIYHDIIKTIMNLLCSCFC